MQHLLKDDIPTFDTQYRNILHTNWNEEAIFHGGIPTDAVTLWSGILQYRDLLHSGPFKELGNYALSCLTTPVSNAVVERIFSFVTSIKKNPEAE